MTAPDPFHPVVAEDRLDPRFKQVTEAPGYAPARATIREWFATMGGRDPNFLEQFQTTGFDARLSELYLFAAFKSAGFDVNWEGDAPDFLLKGHGYEWAVEAPPPTRREVSRRKHSQTTWRTT